MHTEGDSTADPAAEFFGSGLYHEAELPLRWTATASDFVLPQSVADTNVRLLQAVMQLDERPMSMDDAEPQELELARLHAKVDLLIGAVGALLRQSQVLPESVPVRIAADRIGWRGECADAQGLVDLYLHPAFVQPLRLRVTGIRRAGSWTLGYIDALGDAEHSALERHIFLLHRRLIADRRTQARRSSGRT